MWLLGISDPSTVVLMGPKSPTTTDWMFYTPYKKINGISTTYQPQTGYILAGFSDTHQSTHHYQPIILLHPRSDPTNQPPSSSAWTQETVKWNHLPPADRSEAFSTDEDSLAPWDPETNKAPVLLPSLGKKGRKTS